jgi:hypothetical protein
MRGCRLPLARRLVDPLEVVEGIRWEILEANRAGDRLWERLAHLGEALDLVSALEEAVEDAIRITVMDLHARGYGEDGESLEGV